MALMEEFIAIQNRAQPRKPRSDSKTRHYGTVVRRGTLRYIRLLPPETSKYQELGPYQDFLSAREAIFLSNPPHTPIPEDAFDRILKARIAYFGDE